MRKQGLIFILGGFASIVIAIFQALKPLQALYQQLSEDPLADPKTPENLVSGQMLWALAWGIPGLILLILGKIMMSRGSARARQRRQATNLADELARQRAKR